MKMVKALAQAFLRLLWILTLAKCKIPDAHLTCLFSEDCVLPCSFKPSGNEIISWYRQELLLLSHSHQGGDQSDQPPKGHRTRMYLLQDQLSRGNASLHLSQCGIKDRGRYRCLVNSTLGQQESFIIMKVEAPIKMVTMEISKNTEIQCLSKDIFPAPRVQWSTLPPKANLRSTTHMAPNTEGLYSVQSKLRMFGNTPTYVCTVNSTYGSQSWKSSLQKRELIGEAGRELSIPCMAPQNFQNFFLTWTFTRTNDNSKVILSYVSQTRRTSNLWEGRVELEQDRVLMGDGSLLLHNPESQEHTGTYTCTFSGFQSRHMVQTQVAIRSTSRRSLTDNMPNAEDQVGRTGESHSKMWVIAVIVAVVALVTTAILLYRKQRANQGKADRTTLEDTEMQPMKTIKTSDDLPMDKCQLTAGQNNGHT
ncbi:uncharacterized protein LOC109872998 [Oncorhynchus kisutch]|uniref:uncharacterized protein LOC109872998 n=1 Tax=Oncorhynchus kisutch TaxID=8019 RepID=UPI0009A065F8|nr:uncharacterized protein LOC109872998 [Oncorhynchus kisutch]